MKFFTVEERKKERKKLLVEELSRIVEVIKEEYDPERVIVFGSMAGKNIHGAPRASPWSPQNHTHLRQGFGGSSAGERNPSKHDTLIAEMVYHALTHSSTAKAVVSCVGG
jgi:hypothetical protein